MPPRQARRFGAELVLARRLVDIVHEDDGYRARLSDATEVRTRSVLAASGVDWRRLDVDGLDELLGAGVYYGAGPSEAVSCRGCRWRLSAVEIPPAKPSCGSRDTHHG